MRRDARRVAIVGLHSLEFLDEIPPVTIIRVLLQSGYDVPEIKTAGCEDQEFHGYPDRRRAGFAALAPNSSSSSSAAALSR